MTDNKPAQAKTHLLTLRESRTALVVPLVIGLILCIFSIGTLIGKQDRTAGLCCLGALMQFITLPSSWKLYRQVKRGAAVYVVPKSSQFQMPQSVSLVIVLVLTLLVGGCSIAIVLAAHTIFDMLLRWSVEVGVLLFLWLFVAYCWYRVFTQKPSARPVLFQEQPEGVWPPAPRVAVEDDNKD